MSKPSNFPNRKIEQRDSPECATNYSNHVKIEITPWEFTLGFGRVLEASEHKFLAEIMAKIIMSPEHAKVFANVLNNNIAIYEQKFGPIRNFEHLQAAAKTE